MPSSDFTQRLVAVQARIRHSSAYRSQMKLRQGQVWQRAGEFIHIVRVERLEVEFKSRKKLTDKGGANQIVTKKEFCRLLKTAELIPAAELT